MSKEDGDNSVNPLIHFTAGMKDFFRVDKVRLVNIIGSIQYGLLYAVVFFFLGIWMEYLFPNFSKSIPIHHMTLQVILQCLVIIIVIFYARKLVESIPGIPSFFPDYFNIKKLREQGLIPYGIEEYKGETMLAFVLVGTQVNLLQKIGYLSHIGVKNLF